MGKSRKTASAIVAPVAPVKVLPSNAFKAFLATVLQQERLIGKKQAMAEGTASTAETVMKAIANGIEPVDPAIMEKVNQVILDLQDFAPNSDFEASVVNATTDAMLAGFVNPVQAPWVVWACKVISDSKNPQVQGNILPAGKSSYDVRLMEVRTVNTRFGTQTVFTFNTKDGDCIVWWTGSPANLAIGDCYRVEGTIKDGARVFKGVNQNSITRPRFTKIAGF